MCKYTNTTCIVPGAQSNRQRNVRFHRLQQNEGISLSREDFQALNASLQQRATQNINRLRSSITRQHLNSNMRSSSAAKTKSVWENADKDITTAVVLSLESSGYGRFEHYLPRAVEEPSLLDADAK